MNLAVGEKRNPSSLEPSSQVYGSDARGWPCMASMLYIKKKGEKLK
jgi:hypothetical protein